MCFSLEMSVGVALLGLFNCVWLWRRTHSTYVTLCCGYFFGMEVLQVAQYMVADACDSRLNQWLTVIAWLHIAFQPVFSNLAVYAWSKPGSRREMWFAVKLSVVAGFYLGARIFLAHLNPPGVGQHAPDAQSEWMQGPRTCSYRGPTHIAWETPLLAPSYWVPATFIHQFMMFIPGALVGTWIIEYVIMFSFGPVLAAFITSNRYEQPAIWCFFSVVQICVIFNLRIWRLGSPAELAEMELRAAATEREQSPKQNGQGRSEYVKRIKAL